MKTLTETIYTFSELPKEAQQKAISNYLDINTDYRWFDYIEEDAYVSRNLKKVAAFLIGKRSDAFNINSAC